MRIRTILIICSLALPTTASELALAQGPTRTECEILLCIGQMSEPACRPARQLYKRLLRKGRPIPTVAECSDPDAPWARATDSTPGSVGSSSGVETQPIQRKVE